MTVVIKSLGRVDYDKIWQAMQAFTNSRTEDTLDEFWIVEHEPVFTLGLAGKEEHILFKNHDIPIIHCDRGGQVTYHGPGQIVIYVLIDLKRNNLSIRDLVTKLENGIITYLATFGVVANGDRAAPGVYIANKKIASMGLKVRRGCTYHGISFNYNMDLLPFNYINPCGYAGLQVTQLCDELNLLNKIVPDIVTVSQKLCEQISHSIYFLK